MSKYGEGGKFMEFFPREAFEVQLLGKGAPKNFIRKFENNLVQLP